MGYRPGTWCSARFITPKAEPAALAIIPAYAGAALRREPQCPDAVVRAYLKKQQSLSALPQRMREALGARLDRATQSAAAPRACAQACESQRNAAPSFSRAEECRTPQSEQDEEAKVTWTNENASKVSIPTAKAVIDAGERDEEPPVGRHVLLRPPRQPANRTGEQPEPTDDVPTRPRLEQRPSHWSSRIRAFCRSLSTMRVPKPSPTSGRCGEFLERRPDIGDSTAPPCRSPLAACSAMRPPWREECVPHARERSGRRRERRRGRPGGRGHCFLVALGLSQRKTRRMTRLITIAVRERVASIPSTSRAAAAHQRWWPVRRAR